MREQSPNPTEQLPANRMSPQQELAEIAAKTNGKPAVAIRPCRQIDFETIYAIVNDAAEAYRGAIPADCWRVPYMSREELRYEIRQSLNSGRGGMKQERSHRAPRISPYAAGPGLACVCTTEGDGGLERWLWIGVAAVDVKKTGIPLSTGSCYSPTELPIRKAARLAEESLDTSPSAGNAQCPACGESIGPAVLPSLGRRHFSPICAGGCCGCRRTG